VLAHAEGALTAIGWGALFGGWAERRAHEGTTHTCHRVAPEIVDHATSHGFMFASFASVTGNDGDPDMRYYLIPTTSHGDYVRTMAWAAWRAQVEWTLEDAG